MKTKIYTLIMLCLLFSLSKAQYQINAYKVTSLQPSEPGSEVENCIDDNDATIYHSLWNANGIPDQLDFYFVDVQSINKLEYIPRATETNGIWTKVAVYYSTQDNPNTFIQVKSQLVWAENNKKKTIDLSSSPLLKPYIVRLYITEGGGNFSSCAEMNFYSSQQPPVYSIDDCKPPVGGLSAVINNVKVPVIAEGSFASSKETKNENNSLKMSFDGDTSTFYHSEWEPTSNVFPITLNYHFDGTKPIGYLRYIPRQDGQNNGFFGKVSILYNTKSNTTYIPLMNYDFGMTGAITDVHFPCNIIPANIKIVVQNGLNNFASCAEMAFYPKKVLPYQDIFADNIYSELKPGVTQEIIEGITNSFYKALALCLFNKTYNKKYRVKSYEVYPTLKTTRNALKTDSYDSFENMTGIVFKANTKIVLFMDSAPSSVFLKVHNFANEGKFTERSYPLKAGLNIINSQTGGLGYISYYNDNSTLPPVKINIVTGTLNGYFDSTTTITAAEWKTLLLNNASHKLDIRGKYIHLVFDKSVLRTYVPDNPVEFINTYDNIIRQQRILMGLFKYGKSPKNRQFAYTESKGGWFQYNPGAHFDLTWGPANCTSVSNMDYWGVGHELGHVNQIRPNLSWIGLSEVTNNIYSAWIEYTMNKVVPRLEREPFKTSDSGAELEGGKANKSVNYTLVGKKNVLRTIAENLEDYNFLIFRPFWQLELYYQVAGAARGGLALTDEEYPSSTSAVDYAHWYGYVAEKSRNTDATNLTNGQLSMEFVKNTCDAVQEDLTDFFINAGFLRPINANLDDYGVQNITVTQNMIDATIAAIKAKKYSKPVSPVMNYINAHNVKVFRDKLPLSGTTGNGVTLINTATGPQLKVDQVNVWKNVVAYEVYDAYGALARISLAGIGDTTNHTTIIEYPTGSAKVYAVGYDGSKILVYPKTSAASKAKTSASPEVSKVSKLKIYPNPAKSSDTVKLELADSKGKYTMSVYSLSGSLVLQSEGDIKTLNDNLNNSLSTFNSGIYLVSVKDEKGQVYKTRLIKN